MGLNSEKRDRIPGFVKKLRDLMNGMDNTSFAKKVGISRQTLGYYLNGDRLPDAVNLIKICRACHVTSDYLLGLSEIPIPEEDIHVAAKTTGLSWRAIRALTSPEVQFKVRWDKTLNKIIESKQFPDIVADLSTYLWGISYEKRAPGVTHTCAITDSDLSKFGEIIQDAMIHRLSVSLNSIRDQLPQSYNSGAEFKAAWDALTKEKRENGHVEIARAFNSDGTIEEKRRYVPPKKPDTTKTD